MTITTLKRCSKCGEEKEAGAFHAVGVGLHSQCKACRSRVASARYLRDIEQSRRKAREASVRNRAKIRIYRRAYYTEQRYGLAPDVVDEFVSAYLLVNGPVCASCRDECEVVGGVKRPGLKRLVLDHCHRTGRLRGMLCDFCNTALGKLKDSPKRIDQLRRYVETR